MKITLIFKKREKPIPEFEQVGQALEELKKAIMESAMQIPISIVKKLKATGKRGSRAGRKLRRIIRKLYK